LTTDVGFMEFCQMILGSDAPLRPYHVAIVENLQRGSTLSLRFSKKTGGASFERLMALATRRPSGAKPRRASKKNG
jgi:hypothetical protein